MNPILRNILAVITGVIIGGIANMAIIILSPYILPPPAGADFTTAEGLNANMHLMTPKYFIFPFIAHAMHALVGGFIAYKIAATYKMRISFIVGIIVLIAGIGAVIEIPAPLWYDILDLVMCYIPMAYLGGKIGEKYSFDK